MWHDLGGGGEEKLAVGGEVLHEHGVCANARVDGEWEIRRKGLEKAVEFVGEVHLVGETKAGGIEQDDVENGREMLQEFVAVGVGRCAGGFFDRGGCAVVLFKGGDGLGGVVVEDGEGRGGKAMDDAAGAVLDGDVGEDGASGAVQRVGRVLRGGGGWLLCCCGREVCGSEDQGRQG